MCLCFRPIYSGRLSADTFCGMLGVYGRTSRSDLVVVCVLFRLAGCRGWLVCWVLISFSVALGSEFNL